MEKVLAIFDFVFGCHHRQLSRVFTVDGRSYRVCCGCGAEFRYSLATMSMQSRFRQHSSDAHKNLPKLAFSRYPDSGTKKLRGLGISYVR